MAFRDDRDALRAKSEALEEEVESLEDELDRARAALSAHEQKDARDEAELEKLRAEVERLRRKAGEDGPAKREDARTKEANGRRVRVALAGVAIAAVVAVVWLQTRAPQTVEAPSPATEAASVDPVTPEPPPPPGPGPLDVIRFGAVVTRAEGAALAVADGCVVEAEVAGDGVGGVWVHCDGTLYDSNQPGGVEITMHDSGLRALPLPSGRASYAMTYSDTGTRTGPRPQIAIDTQRQTMRVWREGADPFDVRFYVEDRSTPLEADTTPGSVLASGLAPVHLAATARETGELRRFEAPCELSVHAETAGALDCRVLLRCGEEIVYGAGHSGYNRCRAAEELATPIGADDESPTSVDTDPEMHLDLLERTMRIADDGPEPWRAELALAPDPRCGLDGSWAGRVRTAEGDVPGVSLGPTSVSTRVVVRNGRTLSQTRTQGPSTLTVPGLAGGEATIELDCERGTGTIAVEGARFEGRFGPGFATFLAERTGEGPPARLWLRRAGGEALAGVSTQIDLSVVPAGAREAVRRAIRE